ncbi:MAG: hypothetical protein ACRDTR_23925 [Rubrobacter sp.]
MLILAGRIQKGQDERRGYNPVARDEYRVVAVTLFGKIEVASYPTLEQAEWRARELNAEAERSPRGYIQYLVRPAESPPPGG